MKTKNKKIPIVVMISGNGTNLQAIIDKTKAGELDVEIKAVVSNKAEAFGLVRAQKAGIPTEILSLGEFQNRPEIKQESDKDAIRRLYCAELAKLVKKYNPELVVLAGWMLILKNEFLKEFPMCVINLHPALIPAFPGTEAIKQAFDYGAKITGVTVHFVPDEGVDTGPIILQGPVKIEENDTLESLERKIHAVEHALLPKAIQLFAEKRLEVLGRKVKIISNCFT